MGKILLHSSHVYELPLTSTERIVLEVIEHEILKHKNRQCWLTNETIADIINKSEGTVNNILKSLRDKNITIHEKRFPSNEGRAITLNPDLLKELLDDYSTSVHDFMYLIQEETSHFNQQKHFKF